MPGYSGHGKVADSKGLAIAGLVCGIVGLFVLPIILGLSR